MKVDNKWYNVDATWDAGNLEKIGYWKYALLDDKSFKESHKEFDIIYTNHYKCTDQDNRIIIPDSHCRKNEGGSR